MKFATKVMLASIMGTPFSLSANAMLEEVIVTAQKREQSIQDTPISMVALGADSLEQRGISSLGDIAASVPNVKITPTPTNTTATTIAIRGSVTHNPAISWEPTVGVYIDNVYVAKNTGANFDVADISRVELLRGPQGTLYGKNTIGGAVNFITQRPSGELEGSVTASAGNYDLRALRGSLNLPAVALSIGELKSKVVASKRERGGLYKNISDPYANPLAEQVPGSELNDLEREAYRLDLLLDGQQYSARYVFDYSDIKQAPAKGQLTYVDVTDMSLGPLPPSFADYLTSPKDNHKRSSLNRAQREETNNRSHSLFFDYDLSDQVAVKYIANAREMTAADQVDIDGSPLDIFGSEKFIDYRQQSHELQVNGGVGPNQWVVGVYYFKEKADAAQPIDFFPFLYSDPIFGAYYARQDNEFGFDNDALAVFGQAEWQPQAAWLNKQLTLTAGLRWTEEDKKAYIRNDGVTPFSAKDSKRFSNLSPTLIASWEFNDKFNAYAKFAYGWKSGGFNGEAATLDAFLSPYDEETVQSVELGMKSSTLDGRLRLNLAVFRNTTKDMQQTIFIGGGGAQSNVENAGKSTIDGFEVELLASPLRNLQLGLSYGYLDAQYNKFADTDPLTGERRDFASEKDFPYTPRHSVGAHVDYLVVQGDWGDLRAYLDYQYVDDYVPYVNPTQNETSEVSSYALLNGRLTLGSLRLGSSGTLDIGLWGKNLLDREYRSNTVPFGPWTVSYFGDPRTYGVDLQYSF